MYPGSLPSPCMGPVFLNRAQEEMSTTHKKTHRQIQSHAGTATCIVICQVHNHQTWSWKIQRDLQILELLCEMVDKHVSLRSMGVTSTLERWKPLYTKHFDQYLYLTT